MRRANGRNTMYASNSSSGFLFDECEVTIEAGSRRIDVADPIIDQHIFDINSNIQNTSGGTNGVPGAGGIIRNPKVIIQGYMSSDNWVAQAINITSNPGVLIEGTYNPLVADDGNRRGLIQAPPRIVSGTSPAFVSANRGPRINCDAPGLVVRNMRLRTVAATPNGTGVSATIPDTTNQIDQGYSATVTATISGIAALGTGTGAATLSTLTGWRGISVMQIGAERMEFVVVDDATRAVAITSRGFDGTTPSSHSNGATATAIDYSRIENCIADATRIVGPRGVQSGNITNAAYAAL
jgi:hypothetical protein